MSKTDEPIFQVVLNDEEQHSVWPAAQAIPQGWVASGFQGTKEECLQNVSQVWTDIRPLSLRRTLPQ